MRGIVAQHLSTGRDALFQYVENQFIQPTLKSPSTLDSVTLGNDGIQPTIELINWIKELDPRLQSNVLARFGMYEFAVVLIARDTTIQHFVDWLSYEFGKSYDKSHGDSMYAWGGDYPMLNLRPVSSWRFQLDRHPFFIVTTGNKPILDEEGKFTHKFESLDIFRFEIVEASKKSLQITFGCMVEHKGVRKMLDSVIVAFQKIHPEAKFITVYEPIKK